jgi:hypothetical protein
MRASLSIRLALLVIAVEFSFLSCGTCNVRPVVTSIHPDTVTAGSGQFVLTVDGSDFVPGAMVNWNGSFRRTTFVNSQQLTAVITASDVAAAGTVVAFVFNPPGSTTYVFGFMGNNGCGGDSNAVLFTIAP